MQSTPTYTDSQQTHVGQSANLAEDFTANEKSCETHDTLNQAAAHVKTQAQEKIANLTEIITTYTQENPLQAVCIAAVAGLLVAQLLRK